MLKECEICFLKKKCFSVKCCKKEMCETCYRHVMRTNPKCPFCRDQTDFKKGLVLKKKPVKKRVVKTITVKTITIKTITVETITIVKRK